MSEQGGVETGGEVQRLVDLVKVALHEACAAKLVHRTRGGKAVDCAGSVRESAKMVACQGRGKMKG